MNGLVPKLFSMRRCLVVCLVITGLPFFVAGLKCLPEPADDLEDFYRQTWPTSLHATRQGKVTFYCAENNGFERVTEAPIGDLWCLNCHGGTRADGTPLDSRTYKPDCTDCHTSFDIPVLESVCFKCHPRRRLEQAHYTDVHRDARMTCTDCHTMREIHGDGIAYASMMEPGAMDTSCEACHTPLPSNTSHTIHSCNVHCSACHAQSVIACYNCHFQPDVSSSEITTHVAATMRDFTFLVEHGCTGQVHAASMVPLTWQDRSFVLIMPYSSHTISAKGRSCDQCHDNKAMREYADTLGITIARWDDDRSELTGPQGVVPIPPDWRESLQFDFVRYTGNPALTEDDPGQWQFLKSGADVMQMMYAHPLSEEQMSHLAIPRYAD